LHGFNTNLLQSVNYPYEVDEGLGLIEDEGHYVESLQFNDLDRSLKVLESIKDDLAAVIVEPVLGGAGCILPKKGYLEGLQEFVQKNDSLFILDEIVTGFRFSYGAAQDNFKLEPDLFTLGKIIGGGLPIGAVCGKKEIMKMADATTEGDKSTYCSIGGGTFSANPLTMKAGYHTLKTLRNDTSIYDRINNLGEITRVGLSKIFNELKIRAEVTGIGSLFMIHFLNDKVKTINNALDAALSNKELLNNYNLALLARHNIFFLPGKMGAFSNAHEKKDSIRLLNATRNIFENSNSTTS
jgi:glutamate-1-semialdehyde 2,1-aminomutase